MGKAVPGWWLVVTFAEQLSWAVGGVHEAIAVQEVLAVNSMLVGQLVNTGFVLSLMVTVKLHVA
jgi:hypothetical protein